MKGQEKVRCDEPGCGAIVKSQGLGTHKRLKHGITIKRTVIKKGGQIIGKPSLYVAKKDVIVEEVKVVKELVVVDYLNGITSDGRKRTNCRLCQKELWVKKEIADRDSCGCVVCSWCIERTNNCKDLKDASIYLTGHMCDVNGVSLKEISLRK
jgi:hypothetical protein